MKELEGIGTLWNEPQNCDTEIRKNGDEKWGQCTKFTLFRIQGCEFIVGERRGLA